MALAPRVVEYTLTEQLLPVSIGRRPKLVWQGDELLLRSRVVMLLLLLLILVEQVAALFQLGGLM